MKLIVGVGNVGPQYAQTRHNLGFMALDHLVEQQGWPNFEAMPKFKALVSQVSAADKLILAKPTTMMNLSGQAVGELARFYKLEATDIWAIYDDIDLDFGQLRIRVGGGSAGHNGVKSIIEAIGPDFTRFRIGIRNSDSQNTPTDRFVLDQFSSEEQSNLPRIISTTASLISSHLTESVLSEQTYSLLDYEAL